LIFQAIRRKYCRIKSAAEVNSILQFLLENMRREGYELQVSQPQVIIKEVDGEKLEPYEEVIIDVPKDARALLLKN
jgi:GTP-binding protein